jgi:[ribosomal protein S18]-alanine N-acetyltransferase
MLSPHLSNGAEFRKAALSDLPGINEVEQLSFVHAGERFTESRVRYLIVNPRAAVTVAVQDDRVLGWAAGLIWLRGREPWGRIYALAVHPQSRGQRLGPRLLKDMIESLRTRGAGRIFLEVRVDNDAAIRLYQSVGFRPCRLLTNYYGPDMPAQRMALPAAVTAPSPAASP